MSYKEIAEILNCSPQNVRSIEQHILKKIRRYLELRGVEISDIEIFTKEYND